LASKRKKRRRGEMRMLVAATLGALSLGTLASTANADQVYHSQHLVLHSIGGSPLGQGFVENIHPNGPQVFAHELYVLNGAEPGTTYHVTLYLFPLNTSCSGTPVLIPTASFVTNAAGNGLGQFVFRPGDVPPALRNATHSLWWEVTSGTSTYRTTCSAVTLD
jgi:hypothetical protein